VVLPLRIGMAEATWDWFVPLILPEVLFILEAALIVRFQVPVSGLPQRLFTNKKYLPWLWFSVNRAAHSKAKPGLCHKARRWGKSTVIRQTVSPVYYRFFLVFFSFCFESINEQTKQSLVLKSVGQLK